MPKQKILSNLFDLQNELEQASSFDNESLKDLKTKIQDSINLISNCSTAIAEPKKLEKIVYKMRKTTNLDSLMKTTVVELKQTLDVNRVVIYRFDEHKLGTVVAEALTSGYTPMSGKRLPVEGFGIEANDKLESFQCQKQISNLEKVSLTPYQLQTMEHYQVVASACVPILFGDGIWGLLIVQQCTGERAWSDSEMALLNSVAQEILVQLQVVDIREQLEQKVAVDRLRSQISSKILELQNINSIFNYTCDSIRHFLKCDRVAIYQFQDDWSGEFIVDSVAAGWVSLLEEQRKNPAIVQNVNSCSIKDLAKNAQFAASSTDTYIRQRQGQVFEHSQIYRVREDIYNSGFSDCYLEVLESYQARAYIITAIYRNNKLWGLLAAFQNGDARKWSPEEIHLVVETGKQLKIAIQQTEIREQLEQKVAVDRLRSQISSKILELQNINSIFNYTCDSIRHFLKCDRVAIYQFQDDWSGEFIVDSVAAGWVSLLEEQRKNPAIVQNVNSCSIKDLAKNAQFAASSTDTYIRQRQGQVFEHSQIYRVREDIYNSGFSDCYLEVLESYQARAYIITAIYRNDQLWGLLAVYQNGDARKWSPEEIHLVVETGKQLKIAIQQCEYNHKIKANNLELQLKATREKTLNKIVEQVRQSIDLELIFESTCREMRQFLNADRVAIFKVDAATNYSIGECIAEDVLNQYISAIKTKVEDHCLAEKYADKQQMWVSVIDNVQAAELKACHKAMLTKFEVKANLVVPLLIGEQLWGLFCVHQCATPRQWQTEEIDFVKQISTQLGVALNQKQYINQIEQRQQELSLAEQIDREVVQRLKKLAQSETELEQFFHYILAKLRQLFQCHRVSIYQFASNWSGEYIAESVSHDSIPLVGSEVKTVWEDDYLQQTEGGRYRLGETLAVNDIQTRDYSQRHLEILEQFQIKAYLVAPIFVEDKLWGLLTAYQNTGSRQWKTFEIEQLKKLANQLGLGIQQSEYVKELQNRGQELAKKANREESMIKFSARLVDTLSDVIRQNRDLQEILEFTSSELRRILKCDRVSILRFNEDWSGEFIIESVNEQYSKVVGSELAYIKDIYLQDTQGGRYARKESLKVSDLRYLTDEQYHHHLNLFEKWETKAYAIAPIFQGKKLWGLLGIYQNSEIRNWEDSEIAILEQVGTQIGITLLLSTFFTQVQEQEKQLQASAEREKQAREQLQMEAVQMLQALQPSFQGDLTVRAPLSETELGTIANGYNTTISSVRELVKQVKDAAIKVGETSERNSLSVTQLSTQAQQQVNQLKNALQQLQAMVKSTEAVANNAQKVGQAVQNANRTVQAGDSLMEKTVDEMLEIRETVSKTAKKIKRLGEASQKISKVVNLIENFATQTNLLALNAAIEATRAGEYGKGFAVVADEVRSLAYQSANATTEIERFVQDIQTEINEVTEAMEVGISQVVRGSDLVDETRNSLNAIMMATNEITELVAGITETTASQSNQSQVLTTAMTDVSYAAQKTSESSVQISESFRKLLVTSQDLQTSVSKFKVD